ncbi:Nucleotide-diphospho-sugar transferase family protein [Abeliophyllum distichum]|uniref:Glycosyltransferase n=1 Tax=Abeliophyllum distichum TaxID=126358 RepID=A0ABD1UPH8_9LAMI
MDISKNRIVDYTLYLLLFFGFTYILFLNPGKSRPLLSLQMPQCQTLKTTQYQMAVYRDKLDVALSTTSTENKTLLICIVNKAYVDGDKPMLDLFLDGFWVGKDTKTLINHLLIVAMDQTSYERCKFLKLHCYKLETDDVDFVSEKLYMSDDFIKMMWRRTLFLRDVLKHGYNFIYTDTDVLWLRNPFPHLSLNQTMDLQISTDNFNGNQLSEANPINTGFYMINSNNKTIALFDSWYANKDNSTGLKEQDVLMRLMHQGLFRKLGLKVRFLDTIYFSGFCQDSRDVRAVTTVHANCCRSITAKLADLTAVIHDWKRYKGSSDNQTLTFRWSNHTACRNSWRH